jgi:predicted ATP-dependent serine protease
MAPRLKEAQKLGFRRAVMPAQGELETKMSKLTLHRVTHLRELADGSLSCD